LRDALYSARTPSGVCLRGAGTLQRAPPTSPGTSCYPTGRPPLRDPDEPDPIRAVLAILILLDVLVLLLKL
jgi:hypothetical protein